MTVGALADGAPVSVGEELVQALVRKSMATNSTKMRGRRGMGLDGSRSVSRGTAPTTMAPREPPQPQLEDAPLLAAEPTVSSLDRRDSAAATALLIAAYQDDPLLFTLVPDERRRLRVAEWIIRPVMAEVMEHGLADGAWADGGLVGVALWMPPGTYPTASRRRLTEPGATIALGRMAGLGARRITRSLTAVDRAHPRGPHWYLWFLGVTLSHRDLGIGARLIEAGLARIDAEQEAAYAQIFTERASSLFDRAGFEPSGELALEPELAPGRALWRPARIR